MIYMSFPLKIRGLKKKPRNTRTDRRTDGPTDRPSYRYAWQQGHKSWFRMLIEWLFLGSFNSLVISTACPTMQTYTGVCVKYFSYEFPMEFLRKDTMKKFRNLGTIGFQPLGLVFFENVNSLFLADNLQTFSIYVCPTPFYLFHLWH